MTDRILNLKPQVNNNGTSQEELSAQWRKVRDAADNLWQALAEARPHGRDYQVGSEAQRQYTIDRERIAVMEKNADLIKQAANTTLYLINNPEG